MSASHGPSPRPLCRIYKLTTAPTLARAPFPTRGSLPGDPDDHRAHHGTATAETPRRTTVGLSLTSAYQAFIADQAKLSASLHQVHLTNISTINDTLSHRSLYPKIANESVLNMKHKPSRLSRRNKPTAKFQNLPVVSASNIPATVQ